MTTKSKVPIRSRCLASCATGFALGESGSKRSLISGLRFRPPPRQDYRFTITRSKETRAWTIASRYETGNVFHLCGAPWVHSLEVVVRQRRDVVRERFLSEQR